MCYLIRQQQSEAGRDAAAVPPAPGRLRPRWGIAAGALLIGGLAMATALVTAPATQQRNATAVAAPASAFSPLPSATAAVPAVGVVEQTSVPMDDGVPTAFDARKAAMGPCNHDL